MEDKKPFEIPEHIFQTYYKNINKQLYPNIIQTRNITLEGLKNLIQKNTLVWSNSIYDDGFEFNEGFVTWGSSKIFVYFKKINKEKVYNIYILTEEIKKIDMLIIALNKYKTIDNL